MTHSGDLHSSDLRRLTGPMGFLTVRGFWMHSTGCILRWWPDREEYPTWKAQ